MSLDNGQSTAVLQKCTGEAGSVPRVAAHDVETIVVEALQKQLEKSGKGRGQPPVSDRELIEQWVDRAVIKPQRLRETAALHGIARIDDGPSSFGW
jgi:hypothetical protein